MKKWCWMVLVLLLLTGCGKNASPVSVKEPYALEVEYGDSGVEAMKMNYEWYAADFELQGQPVDPMKFLSEIPFVNETGDKKLALLFAEDPDTLEVSYRTSADGYSQSVQVENPKRKLNAPTDGSSYLYEVKAVWNQTEKAPGWGSCYYYFRYLPVDATGEQKEEVDLYRLVQMEASDLFGVEFFNNLDDQKKTCMSDADKQAILDYLKSYLSTNFVQIEMPEEPADYVLRMAVTHGEQVTLSYGGEGQNTWIMLGSVPYEAGVMDLYTLWEQMEAEAVLLSETPSQDYLATSEMVPLEGQEGTVHLGYLQSLGDGSVIVKTVNWIDDANEPNGFRLEEGDLATWTVAENCQYWVLDHHVGPFGQVEQEALWQWSQSSGYDVLFCLHEAEGQVLAVYEHYIP